MATTVDPNANVQGSLTALSTVMLTIATTAVVLRCWAVYADTSRKLGLDDFFATASLPFYITESALVFWWISLGLGRHEVVVPTEDLAQAGKIVFAAGYLFNTALAFPKFSVIFFYYRIFNRTHRAFYVAMWVAGALNLAWLVTTYFVATFQCTPVEAAWKVVPGSHCVPIGKVYVGTSIVSTVVDFTIILMPIPMLWGLKTSKYRRAFITIVFLCGYCVIITSLGRLITVAQVGARLTEDITWSDVTYIKWVQCEGALSITSACLPNIFGLGRRIHQHGIRAALSRKPLDLSQTGTLTQHDFRKIGDPSAEGSLKTETTKRVGSVSTNTTVPKDPFGSEEELTTLALPQGTKTARHYMERYDDVVV